MFSPRRRRRCNTCNNCTSLDSYESQSPVEYQPHFSLVSSHSSSDVIRSVAPHPSRDVYVTASRDDGLKLYSYQHPELVTNDEVFTEPEILHSLQLDLKKATDQIYCSSWSDSGDFVALGADDGFVWLVHYDNQQKALNKDVDKLRVQSGRLKDLVMMQDSHSTTSTLVITTGWKSDEVAATDLVSGSQFTKYHDPGGHVTSLFTWGGCNFASGSRRKIHIWDFRSPDPSLCLDVLSPCSSVCVDPTGQVLVSGHDNGACHLWDVRNHRVLGDTVQLHSDVVKSVRLSGNAFYLLTGGYDGVIKLTDFHGDLMQPLISTQVGSHTDKVLQCSWHHSNKSFLTTSVDKTVKCWTMLLPEGLDPSANNRPMDNTNGQGSPKRSSIDYTGHSRGSPTDRRSLSTRSDSLTVTPNGQNSTNSTQSPPTIHENITLSLDMNAGASESQVTNSSIAKKSSVTSPMNKCGSAGSKPRGATTDGLPNSSLQISSATSCKTSHLPRRAFSLRHDDGHCETTERPATLRRKQEMGLEQDRRYKSTSTLHTAPTRTASRATSRHVYRDATHRPLSATSNTAMSASTSRLHTTQRAAHREGKSRGSEHRHNDGARVNEVASRPKNASKNDKTGGNSKTSVKPIYKGVGPKCSSPSDRGDTRKRKPADKAETNVTSAYPVRSEGSQVMKTGAGEPDDLNPTKSNPVSFHHVSAGKTTALKSKKKAPKNDSSRKIDGITDDMKHMSVTARAPDGQ